MATAGDSSIVIEKTELLIILIKDDMQENDSRTCIDTPREHISKLASALKLGMRINFMIDPKLKGMFNLEFASREYVTQVERDVQPRICMQGICDSS